MGGGQFQPGHDPRRHRQEARPALEAVSALDVPSAPPDAAPPPKKVKLKPEESVASARRILQARAPSAARRVVDLIGDLDLQAPPCPACGRGSRRDEELILKAAKEILDRAGVTVPKAGLDGEVSAPAIVFPPGTQIAIAVGGLPSVDVRQVSRDLPIAVRADLLESSIEPRVERTEERA